MERHQTGSHVASHVNDVMSTLHAAESFTSPCHLQGLVVFFPSFSYTEQACAHWQRSGALAALEKHKRVFRWAPGARSRERRPLLAFFVAYKPCSCPKT